MNKVNQAYVNEINLLLVVVACCGCSISHQEAHRACWLTHGGNYGDATQNWHGYHVSTVKNILID